MNIGTGVQQGDVETVQRLIAEGWDPDEPDANGRPPLLEAVVRHNGLMVRLLLKSGCTVGAGNPQGETALHLAAASTPLCPEVIEALLEAGADPDLPEKLTGNTALHVLVKHDGDRGVGGRQRTLEVLRHMASHANVNARNLARCTPLHKMVCASDDDEVVCDRVVVLLEAGASANVQDEFKETPLHMAVHRRLLRTVQALVDAAGANVNLADRYLQTPLHCAASKDCAAIVAVLLKQPSCDVNATDLNGDTALHLAAGRGHEGVIRVLLSHRAVDVRVINARGLLPLHNAIESGFVKVVEELLHTNCDLLSRSGCDLAPLDLACSASVWKSRPEISHLLLRAIQDTVDNCGPSETPL